MNAALLFFMLLGQVDTGQANENQANTNSTVNKAESTVRIGSKSFTESVTLGEMATLLGRHRGYTATHTRDLGGTQVLWGAMQKGEIDLYPEYTGTIRQSIYEDSSLPDEEAIRKRLAQDGVLMTKSLGFSNTYQIAMSETLAKELNITKISDLRDHPELKFGVSSEFLDRGDGWPALKRAYELPQEDVRGMEHATAYQAIQGNDIEVMDVYSTDSKIRAYKLRVLEDDRSHFPRYDAVFLYRADLAERAPDFVAALERLEGKIDGEAMLGLNQKVELYHQSEVSVAAAFLESSLGVEVEFNEATLWKRLWRSTLEHLLLVVISLGAAICIAIPLGVIAAKKPLWGWFIVGVTEIIQTIPGLALLVLLAAAFGPIGLPMTGPMPAIIALFMYSLLPIIRNTQAGLQNVPQGLLESAEVLGLKPFARLRMIELPIASRLILAGVKTTAVINVGYAALGGLIGAGGYGQTIMTGLRKFSVPTMLEGAIPAALLAIVVKIGFELLEPTVVPKGLRLDDKPSLLVRKLAKDS